MHKIKMDSKRETNFALINNFPKTDHYFSCNKNNDNTYPKLIKTIQGRLITSLNAEIFQKSIQNNKGNRFWSR